MPGKTEKPPKVVEGSAVWVRKHVNITELIIFDRIVDVRL